MIGSTLDHPMPETPADGATSLRRLAFAVVLSTALLCINGMAEPDGIDPWSLAAAMLWLAAVMGALEYVVRRLERRPGPVWREVLILALTASVTSAFMQGVYWGLVALMPDAFPEGPAARMEAPSLGWAVIEGLIGGCALFGFWALFADLPRRIARHRRTEAERRALSDEAELTRIRATLEPHFVLNTLNAIAGLIGTRPEEARALIATLGDLLRDVMRDAERGERTVAEEVDWMKSFASILEVRHAGRLAFEWYVEPDAERCLVPTLLLQPLVENAAHHGALRGAGGGRVCVSIFVEGDRLVSMIDDDGPGFDPTASTEGRGLAMVRRRIALESPTADLQLCPTPDGTHARVVLPRRMG